MPLVKKYFAQVQVGGVFRNRLVVLYPPVPPFPLQSPSLERYRQDLLEEFNRDKEKYKKMPKGVYSGFKAEDTVCAKTGLIALLAYPTKPAKADNHSYTSFDLIYIDDKGDRVLANQKEVLDAITFHKDFDRYVPNHIEKGDEKSISGMSKAGCERSDSRSDSRPNS